jgi:neutral ceramidase
MGGLRTWRFAHGTHDPLVATAMVVAGDGGAVALCGCDVVWLDDALVRSVRERVAERTDLDAEAVLLGASHTHNGPAVGPMVYPNVPREDVRRRLIEDLVAVLVAAAADRRPARVGWGGADEAAVLENRRCEYRAQRDPADADDLLVQLETGQRPAPENVAPERVESERGRVDGEVSVLAVESTDGERVGTLLNFACHPTNVGGALNDRYSADYVGVLRDELRAAFGDDHRTVFGLGACGELRPRDQSAGFGVVEDIGETLADDARGVDAGGGADRVAWESETLSLRRRRPGDEHLAAARERLAEQAGTENDRALWAAHEALALEDAAPTHEVEVWAARIGDAALVALPGEVFHEHGRAIKERSPFERTLVTTLANGYCGYVPTEAAFERGGYEVILAASSFLERGAGAAMVDAATRVLDHL